MNQIINIIIRQVMGQLINRGVRAGFDKAGKMGQRRSQNVVDDEEQPQLTHEERQMIRQARRARKQAKRAQQTAVTTSRLPKV